MIGFMGIMFAIQFYVSEPNKYYGCQENSPVKCEYSFNR